MLYLRRLGIAAGLASCLTLLSPQGAAGELADATDPAGDVVHVEIDGGPNRSTSPHFAQSADTGTSVRCTPTTPTHKLLPACVSATSTQPGPCRTLSFSEPLMRDILSPSRTPADALANRSSTTKPGTGRLGALASPLTSWWLGTECALPCLAAASTAPAGCVSVPKTGAAPRSTTMPYGVAETTPIGDLSARPLALDFRGASCSTDCRGHGTSRGESRIVQPRMIPPRAASSCVTTRRVHKANGLRRESCSTSMIRVDDAPSP